MNEPATLASRLALALCALLAASLLAITASASPDDSVIDAEAISAYRAGDLDTARTLWLELLEAEPPLVKGPERARILFNLGNLAVRAQRDLEAVGWYSAALRLRPRDADTWANLEFARLNVELEPADRGDLRDTLRRLIGSWTPGESRSIALLALVPLALALAFEALRGGAWRLVSLAALLVALVGLLPLGYSTMTQRDDPVLVIEPKGAPARAEPRPDAERLALLDAGESYERLATYPGWVQVRLAGGRRGWVRDSSVFALDR